MGTGGTTDLDWRSICDSLRDVVTVIDRDRTVRFVNRRFLEAAGVSREAVIGTPIGTLMEESVREDATPYRDAIDRVIEGTSEEERIDVPARTPPLGKHFVEMRITPHVVDGHREGAVIVARDVSRRKEYERVIEEQANALAVLNRLLRHDIRNDMTIVTGWLDILHEESDEHHADLIGKAQRAARHTLELTELAREYAHLITEGEEMELRTVDIADSVEKAVERHADLYEDARFTIETDLPQVGVRATGMVQSVFTNLLRNAVQHNDKDAPEVTISVDETETTVVIRIADNGPGIPDAHKAALMDADPERLDDAGTGLGLYLVRQLVAKAGGEVWIEDNVPEGTVMAVELRKAEPDGTG